MNDPSAGADLGITTLIVFTVWGVLALGFYVWYLWSLSKLFPKLGLPASQGWIPVWNQWQLIQRGDLPGWIVLLGFVPGLGLVAVVVTIMAINRINSEHGKGTGFTVLGALLPPMWAMMLARHIGDAAYGQAGDGWQQGQYAPQAGALPYAVGPDGFGQPGSQPGSAFQQGYSNGPAAQGWQGMPPVQQDPMNGGWQAAPPVQAEAAWQPSEAIPPQGYAPVPPMPPVPPQQQWDQHVAPEPLQSESYMGMRAEDQPAPSPLPPVSLPPAPPAPPAAAMPTQSAMQMPQPPSPVPVQAPQAPPAPPVPPLPPVEAAEPPAPQLPAPPVVPPVTFQQPVFQAEPPSTPAPENNWGFSNTTEGDFERLASEGLHQQSETPLGVSSPPQEMYSWPSVEPEPPIEATSVTPAPQEVAAEAEQVISPTPLVLPVPEAADPAQFAPEPAQPESLVPTPAVDPEPQSSLASVPVPESHAPAPAPAQAFADIEEEIDHTVVVTKRTRWVLELPSGEMLELLGDDIVLGRKPQALEGATVLAIPDDTRTMSKTHARMRRVGDTWTVEDLKSTNGVAVFDESGHSLQIEAGREVEVADRFVIGTLEVRLRPVN